MQSILASGMGSFVELVLSIMQVALPVVMSLKSVVSFEYVPIWSDEYAFPFVNARILFSNTRQTFISRLFG